MAEETLVDGWKALPTDPESLRGRVVEAGARKFYELMTARSGSTLTFDVAYPDEQADFLRVTSQVVDAFLDCLAENEREWIAEERQSKADAWSGATIEDVKPITSVYVVHDLIAVLREVRR